MYDKFYYVKTEFKCLSKGYGVVKMIYNINEFI